MQEGVRRLLNYLGGLTLIDQFNDFAEMNGI